MNFSVREKLGADNQLPGQSGVKYGSALRLPDFRQHLNR
jgi:hypothetical protein